MPFAYLFEAKGIQRYILDSGALRDLVGASDLVAGIAQSSGDDERRDLIGRIVANTAGSVRFSRRAGGAFCIHAKEREPLQLIKAAIRVAVGLHAPGLEFSDAGPLEGATDIDAMKLAYRTGSSLRHNGAAELPPSGNPFTAFAPRTGRLVTTVLPHPGELDFVDVLSGPQRIWSDKLVDSPKGDSVARRFLGDEKTTEGRAFVFPRNLDPEAADDPERNPPFPFRDSDRRIAIVHADLSGLGQTFRTLTEAAAGSGGATDIVFEAAKAIERAITAAAQHAVRTRIIDDKRVGRDRRVLPARPILLGGDDITIIVRADLSLEFAEALLLGIVRETERAFKDLKMKVPNLPVPSHLSACAGVAVAGKGAPFLAVNLLAESLCKFAKAKAKAGAEPPFASALAFHVAQSVAHEEYRDVLVRDDPKRSITGNPYLVGDVPAREPIISFEALRRLANALAGALRGRGNLFEAAQLRYSDPAAARAAVERWQEKLKSSGAWSAIHTALRGVSPVSADPSTDLDAYIGPLCDALEINDLAHAYEQGERVTQ